MDIIPLEIQKGGHILEKRSIFRGAMLGLAVGDAMGNGIDRCTLEDICMTYGPNGLLGYDLINGCAEVTSYTQLAAFCANGILLGLTRGKLGGDMTLLTRYIGLALREWSRSQHFSEAERNFCWLSTVPELKRRRCMDTRLLDALSRNLGTVDNPAYRSNSPSSLTAVIPLALMAQEWDLTQEQIDRMGAEVVALTHGEPEAFLSGAALTHLIGCLYQDPEMPLQDALQDTIDSVQSQFGRSFGQTTRIWELLQYAQILAASDKFTQMEAMERLRCRTASEVLSGVAYALSTCHEDFDTAIITAINHSGHSAAVGAITGGILGMKMGDNALPDFYLESLEATSLLGELAADMVQGGPGEALSRVFDDDWDRKYLHGGL